MTGPVLLAFGIWMLLTSDFSWLNAAIGLAGSIIAALLHPYRFSAVQLARLVFSATIRIPQAIWETLLMVLLPYRHERTSPHRVKRPGQPWAVFHEAFIITFTPRSLVISEEREGELTLHTVERKERR